MKLTARRASLARSAPQLKPRPLGSNTHLDTDNVKLNEVSAPTALFFLILAMSPTRDAHGQASPLNATLLRAAVDTVAVTVEMPGRVVPFATAIESLRRVRRAGRDAWEQSYQWFGNDGSRTADTLWFDAVTLVPLENHRHNGAHDATTIFRPSGASTRLTPRGGSEQVSDTSVAGPLFASGEFAALIRSAPLSDAFATTYALYYGPPRASVRPGPFRVVRSETIKSRSGMAVECWVVDAALSEGLNTFYISKADRRVVRLVNHEDPNAAFVFTR